MDVLNAPKIEPKSPRTRWVALDILTSKILVEGVSPSAVQKRAEKLGKPFSMMFVPKTGVTYIL